MKIPEGQFWSVAADGPGAGYVWKMLDDLELNHGYHFRNEDNVTIGFYYWRGEISNGLKVLEWKERQL